MGQITNCMKQAVDILFPQNEENIFTIIFKEDFYTMLLSTKIQVCLFVKTNFVVFHFPCSILQHERSR
jgi:hypothetical protein